MGALFLCYYFFDPQFFPIYKKQTKKKLHEVAFNISSNGIALQKIKTLFFFFFSLKVVI